MKSVMICAICNLELSTPQINGNQNADHLTFVKCGHFFHNSCVQDVKTYKNCCPYCKKDLGTDGFFKILPMFAETKGQVADESNAEASLASQDYTEQNADVNLYMSRKVRGDLSTEPEYAGMRLGQKRLEEKYRTQEKLRQFRELREREVKKYKNYSPHCRKDGGTNVFFLFKVIPMLDKTEDRAEDGSIIKVGQTLKGNLEQNEGSKVYISRKVRGDLSTKPEYAGMRLVQKRLEEKYRTEEMQREHNELQEPAELDKRIEEFPESDKELELQEPAKLEKKLEERAGFDETLQELAEFNKKLKERTKLYKKLQKQAELNKKLQERAEHRSVVDVLFALCESVF